MMLESPTVTRDMYKASLKMSFWMWLLSAGNPDIIDQLIKILGTLA